jgi:hypothetical protein
MAQIPDSIRVTGFIAPSDSTDIYATHDSKYGRGGLTEVADLTERDAITADRRREGMVVYVAADGQTYQLVGGVDNADWTIFGNAAATLGSYVITVNGISGAVQLTPGDGIGIDSTLTFSVTGDYAFNSTVYNVSAGLYAIDIATSGDLYSITQTASSSLFTLVVDTSAGLKYEIDLAGTALADTSAALYAIDIATSGDLYSITQTASSSLFTLVVDTSAGLKYEIDLAGSTLVATSGELYSITQTSSAALRTLIEDTTGSIDASYVHRLASGPSSETIYNEKIFADTTTFNQDLVVQGAIFAASGVFAVYAESVSAFDNMIELNVGDPGPGVTRGYAGVQVNRGSSVPYQFLFDENRNTFVIGTIDGPVSADGGAAAISELQSVATREDNPKDKGIAVWTELGDGSISPSGAFKFVTNANFTYDSVTGLSTNAIVYDPATPGDWSVAPTEAFQALDTLAADLALAGSDLTGLIVATSGALHAEMVQTSGDLYAIDIATSGELMAVIAATSGNLYAIDVATSGDLYSITVAASSNLYAIDVATSGELYAVIAATSGELMSVVVNTSGDLYSTIYNVSGALWSNVLDISANYATDLDLYNLDLDLQGQISDAAAITVATSSNLYAIDVATSGELYSISVQTSANLITFVQDASASLMGYADAGDVVTLDSAKTYTDAVSASIVSNVVAMFEGGTFACTTSDYGYVINHKTLNAVSDAFPIVSLTVPTSSSVLYVQGITERTVSSFKVVLSDVPDVANFEINWVLFKPYFTTLP